VVLRDGRLPNCGAGTVYADLVIAVEFHRAGRFADAARCYHGLLCREPENAEALHLFGVLHHECGHSGRAVELIRRAAGLRPGNAIFHANLAEAYRSLGEFERAIDCCQTALRLQPACAVAANNFGLALEAQGRLVEAADQFRAALAQRPDFALARNNLGTVLRKLGRLGDALEAFQAAVDLDPRLAIARANLGQALVDSGQAALGLEHCQEGVRIAPELAAAHNNLGNAFRALNRWAEARAAYAEALRLSPELGDARIHANLGLALQRDNQRAQAFSCFRKAVELAPDDPEMWQYLANAHLADEDFAAAIACCERVVALKPEWAQAHVELGWALQEDGRLSDAAVCYRRALELDPDDIHALLKRGGLQEELGAMAEAEASYRRAWLVNCAATTSLACLATLLRGRLPEADRSAIHARLEDPTLEDGPRADLLFGLAHVCDAHGEHAEAAACLKEANALVVAQRKKQNRMYDPAQHSRFVARLMEAFTPSLFERLAGAGDDTLRPVFVFGMPRSGTTLVEQVLASHSRVFGAGELRLARQLFDDVPTIVGHEALMQCLNALDGAGLKRLSQRYCDGVQIILDRADCELTPDRFVDKMPDNYLYLGLLALVFPRATFVHVHRDTRDVALSCWLTNFRSIRWANDPTHLTGRIREHARLMAHWRAVLPLPICEISYERLVADFESESRRLVTACGLGWEPACMQFHQTVRPVRTASVTQVRQPLYRSAVGRWKNYEAHLNNLFGLIGSDQR
jgi:tetratricopeptide (TPR) repeat protein